MLAVGNISLRTPEAEPMEQQFPSKVLSSSVTCVAPKGIALATSGLSKNGDTKINGPQLSVLQSSRTSRG